MGGLPNEGLIEEIEGAAAEMARRAGAILQGQFGGRLDVEYKDKHKQDPVTSVDKESQAYLWDAISRRFPGHSIVAEEASPVEDGPTSDYLWVLDPVDGTTNYLNGLPVYAVSIGVLHRGEPVAGALFVPWPGVDGGLVLHARVGGGTWVGEDRLLIRPCEGPTGSRLVGLPGSFGAQFRPLKNLRQCMGQVRMTGSIAYELALTVFGAFQYIVLGGPRIWDVAAGVLLVTEAGGAVLVMRGRGSHWEPLTTLGPSWENGPPTIQDIRGWRAPVIAGNPQSAPFVAARLRRRRSLSAKVARLLSVLRRVT